MEQGFERHAGETLAGWVARVEPSLASVAQTLKPIVSLHYKYRFDPAGLSSAERASLTAAVKSWLDHSESDARDR